MAVWVPNFLVLIPGSDHFSLIRSSIGTNEFAFCFHRTVVGIKCKDGVVFGVEKLVKSKLYELSSNRRIFTIDTHVGMVCTFQGEVVSPQETPNQMLP